MQVLVELVEKVAEGGLTGADARRLVELPQDAWSAVFGLAGWVKNANMSNSVRLCAIVNAKSGLCDQDCAFCAQAYSDRTSAPRYPLISMDKLMELAEQAERNRATTFSIVTSGRGTRGRDFERILDMVQRLQGRFTSICASLGCLERSQLEELKAAGLRRYHHNLEAGPSFYPKICTTRPYSSNFQTLVWAKEAGLEVCAGGIFGMGESWYDRVELLAELHRVGVDSISLNFLIPIAGTPLEWARSVSPKEGLFCIALARLMHPRRHIIVCGGREARLGELQAAALICGASGIMIGNYLTQPGRPVEQDLEMIEELSLTPEG